MELGPGGDCLDSRDADWWSGGRLSRLHLETLTGGAGGDCLDSRDADWWNGGDCLDSRDADWWSWGLGDCLDSIWRC